MNPITIRKEIEIAAPASSVWHYIGTAAGLRQWWGVDLTLDARLGGHCEERGLHAGEPYRLVGEVTAYEPPYRLALALRATVLHEAWPARTQLEIMLEETAAHTKVVIVHRAFATALVPSIATVVHTTGNPARGPLMALPGNRLATSPMFTQQLPLASLHTLQNWQQITTTAWQRNLFILQTLLTVAVEPEVYA